MTRRDDTAQKLLAMVVGLLPAAQRAWGEAMRAELEGIAAQGDRWSFTLGCALAVLRQAAVLKVLAYMVIGEAAVVGALVWSTGFTYIPLRWTVVAIVLAFAAVIFLGPVARGGNARLARGVGVFVVAVATIGFLAGLRTRDNPLDEVRYVAPFVGAALISYLAGFVAATGDRAIATGRTLRWGLASGVGAALIWTLMVFALGHVPVDLGPALVATTAAVVVAIWGTAQHTTQAWVAAMFAGAIGTLSIVVELVLMSSYAPASMIPDLAPAALTAADDLAQSRSELQDPYVLLFLIGALIGLALAVTNLARRLPRLTAGVTIKP